MGKCSSCGIDTGYPGSGLCVKCYRAYQKTKESVKKLHDAIERQSVADKVRRPWYCLDCHEVMLPIDNDKCKCQKCGIEVWYEYEAPEIFVDKEYVSATRKPWICEDCREPMTMYRDFCKCKKCKTEVWFEWNSPLPKKGEANNYVSRSLPERYRVPPGGSKASGKKAKKKGTKTYTENGFES